MLIAPGKDTACRPPLGIVVAMTRDGVIGHRGRLPWDLPADRRLFRRLTEGNTVIMGRRTFASLPAALADEPAQAALREATLAFDVPQTARDAQPFAAWQARAKALAAALEADVVDDDGRAVADAGFAAIGGELGQLYDALAARDLAAGSAAARRLFS